MSLKKFAGAEEEESPSKVEENKTAKTEDFAFAQVEKILTLGGSGSIKMKRKKESKTNRLSGEDPSEPWYFTHI